MKLFVKSFICLALIAGINSGCEKNDLNNIPVKPLAALTITNVISQGKVVRLNNNVLDSCALNNYKIFTIVASSSTAIKAYASSTPSSPYFNQTLDIANGGIYSLYLTGNITNPESVFVKDNIPAYPKENVVNVRIANLSPNLGSISVTLASAPTLNIFSNISYKQVTEFATLQLPMTIPVGSDTFQIRSSTGTLLLTYKLTGAVSPSSSRHRNITLAIKGLVGGLGTDALGVLGVPHY